MSKKHRKEKNRNRPANGGQVYAQSVAPGVAKESDPIKEAEMLDSKAAEAAAENKAPPVETPASAGQDELRLALQMARQAEANFEAATADLKGKTELAEKEKAEAAAARQESKEKIAAAEKDTAEARTQQEDNKKERERLASLSEDLVRREENAKDGFLKERMAALESLQAEAAKLRTIIAETTAYTTQRRVECDREVADRIAALELREDALQARERQIAQRERQANWREEDVEDLAKARAAHEVERSALERQETETRLHAAREEAQRREARVQELEDTLAKLGGRSVEEVVAQNRTLSGELEAARRDLEARPPADTGRHTAHLEAKVQELTGTVHDLQQELAESRTRAQSAVIAVTELESLRDEKLTLEKRCELLKNANDTLRAEYEQIISKAGQKTPFESCSQKDTAEDLQSAPPSLLEAITDLPAFCQELQQRMAYDPDSGKTLYYSIEDVRCFVAGLCMSRLHILQGISGTGKTSLPKAFARAIGAGWRLVPVQAGWRDREDLIGHYNSFQNKYYESEFLKALYDAQCPAFSERPFVIILDEMNLSHPEQYFADFISLMEQEQSEQIVALTTFPVPNAPRLLVNGSQIRIPPNVWFIGTANHDETTMDFADKTYDRAHVMELPRHRTEFQVQNRQRRQDPLAMSGLLSAVESARGQNGGSAKRVAEYLDCHFLDLLGESFGIGWGNRLERQLDFYVPMVLACGGSIGEATDHILSTKLLRKLRGRHDNTEKALKEVQSVLEDNWIEDEHTPHKSRTMIEEAMRLVV